MRRILQVIDGLPRGGIETWLMHVLRHQDARYRTDILVRNQEAQAYDDEARALGCRVIPCPGYRQPWRFASNFAAVLKTSGPYDVVHSHTYYYSGFVLGLAARHRVPIRIAHSHNDKRSDEAMRGPSWRLYCALMRRQIYRHATLGLAASRQAAESLFGRAWERDGRFRTLNCGIDLRPFREEVDRFAMRKELGFPADALVIGHVGRFVWQKNHAFLLRVVAEAIRQDSRIRVLLLGGGVLRAEIEQQAAALGIADRVRFAGSRSDVPRLMMGAMDALLFPSHHEGLPLVVVEAQAAGLPCVVSDCVPREARIVPGLVRRLPLSAPSADWAGAVLTALRERPFDRARARDIVANSPFDINRSLQVLLALYGNAGAQRRKH